jgi:TonB-dependent starch-binding outer membrane protein SusC
MIQIKTGSVKATTGKCSGSKTRLSTRTDLIFTPKHDKSMLFTVTGHCNGPALRKMLLAMKLTVFLIIIGLHVSAAGISQTITYSAKNVSLEKVFKAIKKQTGYFVVFDKKTLENTATINIDAKNFPVQEFMQLVLKDQSLSYLVRNTTIVIQPSTDNIDSRSIAPVFSNEQPPIDIKGRIVNDKGEPVAGATVTIKGSKRATSTDADGNFLLNGVEEKAQLIITGANIENYEVNIKGQSLLDITVQQKLSPLDQIQIIAYGTTTKRLSTGSISTVKAADIEKQPVTNPLQALQGRVPGLMIEQSSGLPGSGFTVQIRGQNNITNFGKTSDPLYIIDGVPYNSQLVRFPLNSSLGVGSPLDLINPKDIESIDILKDATATSIYGSRAANGVILITTKKGKSGPMSLNIDFYSGFNKPVRGINLMNKEEYLEMRKEAFKNDGLEPGVGDYDLNGIWDTTRNTNWIKLIEQNTARFNNAQLSVSGGNEFNQYLIGATGSKQETGYPAILKDDGVSEFLALHFNMSNSSRDKRFQLILSGSYQSAKNTVQSIPSGTASLLAPDAPKIFNSDGSLNWQPINEGEPGTFFNPFSNLLKPYKALKSNLVSNMILNYKIIKGLDFKTSFGYTNMTIDETNLNPAISFDPGYKIASGFASYQSSKAKGWSIEPQLNYNLKIGNDALTVLVGSSFQENKNVGQALSGQGYSSDALLGSIQSASTITRGGSKNNQYRYNAAFGRLNYNIQNKYIIEANVRRDGSSRFGPGKQFHTFSSIGGGYIFSNELFIKNKISFLSFGKIKGSYGTAGSDFFSDYQFLDLYYATAGAPYQGIAGLYPGNQYNPNLAWEESRKMDVGIELGFLKDRMFLEAGYYKNKYGNQLVSSPTSIVTGFNSIPENRNAIVQNSGLELTLNTTNIKSKNLFWTTSFNISINKNKLVDFPDFESSNYKNIYVKGKSINIVKLFDYVGVNSETGINEFIDRNGEITNTPVDPSDKTIIIDKTPKYFGGFQNSISYKSFQLDFLFQFVKQIGENINNTMTGFGYPGQFNYNMPSVMINRWQKPGDKAEYQKFSTGYDYYYSYVVAAQSLWGYSDASFIRLKNLALSWEIPKQWQNAIRLKKCRMYLQGQNLLTITNYNGMDPETRGFNLPPVHVWTMGFKAAF